MKPIYLLGCAIWSRATAVIMMAPITINWIFVEIPSKVQPLRRKLISSVPIMVPVIVPRPPESEAPPITTATIHSTPIVTAELQ